VTGRDSLSSGCSLESREITSLMNVFPMRRDIRAGRGNYFMLASSAIGLDSGQYNQTVIRAREKERERATSRLQHQARGMRYYIWENWKRPTYIIRLLARVRRRHWPTFAPRLNNECEINICWGDRFVGRYKLLDQNVAWLPQMNSMFNVLMSKGIEGHFWLSKGF